VDGRLAYSKRATGQYPELKELKQAVTDAIGARVSA
jgi:predicted Rdx family selenoprotein